MVTETAINEYLTTHLIAINKIVADFLRTHGGMPNGYETSIDGTFSIVNDCSDNLTWETPKSGDITPNDKRYLSRTLELDLARYFKMHNIKWAVKFESSHVEHGCYTMSSCIIFPRTYFSTSFPTR